MPSSPEADLEYALRKVLEIMCFTDVVGEAECDPTGDALAVRVEFHGDTEGEVRLRMPAETANTLAACFLGKQTPEEVSPAEAAQVAGELSNMICGCFLSRHRADKLFDLSAPEPYPADAAPPEPSMVQNYQLDNGCVHLELSQRPVK